MSAAPIVALTDIRIRAIDGASHKNPTCAPVPARAARRLLRSITDINLVRCGIASQSTAQK
jgi:hypothetical protein